MSVTGNHTVAIASTMSRVLPPPPLIVTAQLDAGAQALLDGLRRAHFPPERNHLAAHLTLFHHLPGAEEDAVTATLREHAARAPLTGTADRPMKLGRGVAV